MSIYVTFAEKIDFLILVTRFNVRDFTECYFLNKYEFITPTWTAGAMLFYSPPYIYVIVKKPIKTSVFGL